MLGESKPRPRKPMCPSAYLRQRPLSSRKPVLHTLGIEEFDPFGFTIRFVAFRDARDMDSKRSAAAQLGIDRDRAPDEVDELLGDSQSKARSSRAGVVIGFTMERLQEPGNEVRIHPSARIRYAY